MPIQLEPSVGAPRGPGGSLFDLGNTGLFFIGDHNEENA